MRVFFMMGFSKGSNSVSSRVSTIMRSAHQRDADARITFLSADLDRADHAGLEVAGNQAGELEVPHG